MLFLGCASSSGLVGRFRHAACTPFLIISIFLLIFKAPLASSAPVSSATVFAMQSSAVSPSVGDCLGTSATHSANYVFDSSNVIYRWNSTQILECEMFGITTLNFSQMAFAPSPSAGEGSYGSYQGDTTSGFYSVAIRYPFTTIYDDGILVITPNSTEALFRVPIYLTLYEVAFGDSSVFRLRGSLPPHSVIVIQGCDFLTEFPRRSVITSYAPWVDFVDCILLVDVTGPVVLHHNSTFFIQSSTFRSGRKSSAAVISTSDFTLGRNASFSFLDNDVSMGNPQSVFFRVLETNRTNPVIARSYSHTDMRVLFEEGAVFRCEDNIINFFAPSANFTNVQLFALAGEMGAFAITSAPNSTLPISASRTLFSFTNNTITSEHGALALYPVVDSMRFDHILLESIIISKNNIESHHPFTLRLGNVTMPTRAPAPRANLGKYNGNTYRVTAAKKQSHIVRKANADFASNDRQLFRAFHCNQPAARRPADQCHHHYGCGKRYSHRQSSYGLQEYRC